MDRGSVVGRVLLYVAAVGRDSSARVVALLQGHRGTVAAAASVGDVLLLLLLPGRVLVHGSPSRIVVGGGVLSPPMPSSGVRPCRDIVGVVKRARQRGGCEGVGRDGNRYGGGARGFRRVKRGEGCGGWWFTWAGQDTREEIYSRARDGFIVGLIENADSEHTVTGGGLRGHGNGKTLSISKLVTLAVLQFHDVWEQFLFFCSLTSLPSTVHLSTTPESQIHVIIYYIITTTLQEVVVVYPGPGRSDVTLSIKPLRRLVIYAAHCSGGTQHNC